jgi:mitogen-activated protein kinase kinase kinase
VAGPGPTMLAKTQYSAGPLGVPTPVTAYHTTTSRPATATKADGVGFTSPTKSEFSDGQDELAAIRLEKARNGVTNHTD